MRAVSVSGVIALAALLVAGCGPARESAGNDEASVVAISPSEVRTKVVGGTPHQQNVLREVLAGLGTTGLTEVEIIESQRRPGSVGLVVPHDAENLMAEWHSWLLAQGFAERSRELDLPVVRFFAGERGATDGESLGPVPAAPAPSFADAMSAAARARKAAEANGADVRRLEILKPYRYAFLIELQVEGDQARFLRYVLPEVLRPLGGPLPFQDSAFGGDYSLVVDGDGHRVWEGAEASTGNQTGGTDSWELADCGPFPRFGPAGRGPPMCPADRVTLAAKTRVTGATPKQETILREILAGLAPTAIETVHVLPAGDWAPEDDPTAVMVRVEYAKTADQNRSEWEVVLLAKAFAARSKSLDLQPVAAYETADGGSALGDGPSEIRRKPVTREELRASIYTAAKKSGAQLVDLELLTPRGLAVAVTLRTEAPAEFLKHRLRSFLDETPEPTRTELDGRYIRIVDSNGREVWSWGLWPYGGIHWARPDLEGCDPVVPLGAPRTWSPPPCPAK